MDDNKVNPKRIGGALILVSLSLFIQSLIALSHWIVLIIEGDFNRVLAGVLYELAASALEGRFLREVIFYCKFSLPALMGIVALYLLYLLFTRSRKFPKFFVRFFSIIVIFVVVDGIDLLYRHWQRFIELDIPLPMFVFYADILLGAMWIPYILKSKRVKDTFLT